MSSTLSKKYLFFFVYAYAQGARAANVCSFEEDKKEDAPARPLRYLTILLSITATISSQ